MRSIWGWIKERRKCTYSWDNHTCWKPKRHLGFIHRCYCGAEADTQMPDPPIRQTD